ncbi:uncharacterized protein FA14DRAFT_161917 [Meira miltonrushii]|uniref:Secreted protein n=1 Tax=Meira miltonrushii TaxID=1280837 RepID=A0A316V4P3_9BASI|nr:uncharacterized protein FA14DRAFT_161917 [Meira miltonrushii]PWN32516.1 hypothetical protein FA14DRAFT_161917 [Meira miltonrushii]
MNSILMIILMQQLLTLTLAGPPLARVVKALKEGARDRARATVTMPTGNKPSRRLILHSDRMSLKRTEFTRIEPIEVDKRAIKD